MGENDLYQTPTKQNKAYTYVYLLGCTVCGLESINNIMLLHRKITISLPSLQLLPIVRMIKMYTLIKYLAHEQNTLLTAAPLICAALEPRLARTPHATGLHLKRGFSHCGQTQAAVQSRSQWTASVNRGFTISWHNTISPKADSHIGMGNLI